MTTKIQLHIGKDAYHLENPDGGISIAITQHFNTQQPNHFGAAQAHKEKLRVGQFIGDTTQGGSCNVDSITMTPHCNGTHTETISHVLNQKLFPHQVITNSLLLAAIVTVQPKQLKKTDETVEESYTPNLLAEDWVIDSQEIKRVMQKLPENIEALIIRTQPNSENKKTRVYGEQQQPAFFTHECMRLISELNTLKHLLVDMPSIDRMYDEGLLSNHRMFWHIQPGVTETNATHREDRTLTEMIYVAECIKDGLYALNLQVPALALDAVPSNPVIYKLIEKRPKV